MLIIHLCTLTSWMLWMLLCTVMGIHIAVTADEFQTISRIHLQGLIPEILSKPKNLYHLLCLMETFKCGIPKLLANTCTTWPLIVWATLERTVKDRPRLASILVSFKCVESFCKISRQEIGLDPSFQIRHKMATRLSRLPVSLDSDSDMELLLSNFELVDELERDWWLDAHRFTKIIGKLYQNQRVLDSGITYYFLVPERHELTNPSVKEQYLKMLASIKHPIDLFGHSSHLKSRLAALGIFGGGERTRLDRQCVRDVLEILERRLKELHYNYNNQSIEGFSHLIHSMSQEEIVKEESINHRLQSCNAIQFQGLVDVICSKLRNGCSKLLSKENRMRLLKFPIISWPIYHWCLERDERIEAFHLQSRKLFKRIPHNFNDFTESLEFLWYDFVKLPPTVNGISLWDFLADRHRCLLDNAKVQLSITTRNGYTHINVKSVANILQMLEMNYEAWFYILVSLIKQLYFRSKEIFEHELLDWIYLLAQNKGEPDKSMTGLKNLIMLIYSCVDFTTFGYCVRKTIDYCSVL